MQGESLSKLIDNSSRLHRLGDFLQLNSVPSL